MLKNKKLIKQFQPWRNINITNELKSTNIEHIWKTMPKPPYGRQGLAGSWGKDTIRRLHFWGFSTSYFALTALSSDCVTLFGYWWGVPTDLSGHSLRKWSFFVSQGGSQLTFYIFRLKIYMKNRSLDGISTLPMYGTIAAAAAATSAGASTNQVSIILKVKLEKKIKLKAQIVENIKEEEVFLLDPSPIIAYPCQSRMLWRPELCDSCCWRCQLKTCWFCRFFWCWHWGYCWWLLTSTAWQEQAMFGKSLTTTFTYSFQYCLSRLRISLL